jgi:hypothetical protein
VNLKINKINHLKKKGKKLNKGKNKRNRALAIRRLITKELEFMSLKSHTDIRKKAGLKKRLEEIIVRNDFKLKEIHKPKEKCI